MVSSSVQRDPGLDTQGRGTVSSRLRSSAGNIFGSLMTAKYDDEIVGLQKRILSLELLARERIALADSYMKKVEELRLEIKEIDIRIRANEKAIGIIQARMAMITAASAVIGAITGELIIRVIQSFIGGP